MVRRVAVGVDGKPQWSLRLGRDLTNRGARSAADDDGSLRCRCAANGRQLAVWMKPALVGDRANENGREVRLAEQLDAQIEVERRDHQSRPERDFVERSAAAAGDGRIDVRVQRDLCRVLELEHVDELLPWRESRFARSWVLHASGASATSGLPGNHESN